MLVGSFFWIHVPAVYSNTGHLTCFHMFEKVLIDLFSSTLICRKVYKFINKRAKALSKDYSLVMPLVLIKFN